MQQLIDALKEYFGEELCDFQLNVESDMQHIYTMNGGMPVTTHIGPQTITLSLVLRTSNPAYFEDIPVIRYVDSFTFGLLRPQTVNRYNEYYSERYTVTNVIFYFLESDVEEIISAIKQKAWNKWNTVISTQIDEVIND